MAVKVRDFARQWEYMHYVPGFVEEARRWTKKFMQINEKEFLKALSEYGFR